MNLFSNHSGYRGAATRADQLLDEMESKYLAGDMGLKPNTFTYNAVSFSSMCAQKDCISSVYAKFSNSFDVSYTGY